MEELFYFVREQYPTIIGNDSKIDYIGVLDYLRDNTDVPVSYTHQMCIRDRADCMTKSVVRQKERLCL